MVDPGGAGIGRLLALLFARVMRSCPLTWFCSFSVVTGLLQLFAMGTQYVGKRLELFGFLAKQLQNLLRVGLMQLLSK
jgi:muramoyltetrapeptide carboxypeptidase LdcA involved in peptidoglycan recycling